MTTRTDEERFEYIAQNCKSLIVNEWLVQGIVEGEWFSAYYRAPSKEMIPETLYANRLEAVRIVVDAMMDSGLKYGDKKAKKSDFV